MKNAIKIKKNSFGGKDRTIKEGTICRDWNGNLYRIITVATNTKNNVDEVIYISLYAPHKTWAKAVTDFLDFVPEALAEKSKQEYQFEFVEFVNVKKSV